MSDVYRLIANQIRDFHHIFDEKIKNDPKKRPVWTVNKEGIIEEIYPLLGLANLLERMSGHQLPVEGRLAHIEHLISERLGEIGNA